MRNRHDRDQKGRLGWTLASRLVLLGLLGLGLPGLSVAVDPSPLGGAAIVDTPQFTYEIVEVYFEKARDISSGAGKISRSEMVKVVVQGEGFRQRATGPVLWLNGIPTPRAQVAEDGRFLEAWFLEPLQTLEEAADKLGRWELIYQPHAGALTVFRISPTGHPGNVNGRPVIKQQRN